MRRRLLVAQQLPVDRRVLLLADIVVMHVERVYIPVLGERALDVLCPCWSNVVVEEVDLLQRRVVVQRAGNGLGPFLPDLVPAQV